MDQTQYQTFLNVDDRHWWFVARREIIAAILKTHLGSRSDLNIVDIGSGTGRILPVLSQFGNVTLTEPEATVSAWAKTHYAERFPEAKFVSGNWETLDFPPSSYDLLTAFDVLEHCQDDLAALKRWGEWVKPGGKILLTVPAFPSLWGINDEVSHHFRRYTAASLRQVIAAAGFRIEKMTYMNMLLFLPVWLSRNLLDRLRRALNSTPPHSTDFNIPSEPINSLLRCLYGWEAHWLPAHRLPFGTSLIVVIQV